MTESTNGNEEIMQPEATIDEDPARAPSPQELPGNTIPTSTYELVVVAAREARRINDRLKRLTDDKADKVTTRAIDRVLAGQVRFAYEDEAPGS